MKLFKVLLQLFSALLLVGMSLSWIFRALLASSEVDSPDIRQVLILTVVVALLALLTGIPTIVSLYSMWGIFIKCMR